MSKPQGVIPMIAYADGVAALDWLARVFDFQEHTRCIGSDGLLSHAEMETGEGLIMLATPTPDYEGPKQHRKHCEPADAWSKVPWVIDGVLVLVDDVDAHHARVEKAGATILSIPEDGPHGRHYRVEDLEGHRWMFMQKQPVR